MFALREGRWKLIEGLGSGGFTQPVKMAPQVEGPKGQLFDLSQDPNEREDVYAKEPAQVARLSGVLQRIRDEGRTRRL